MGALGNVKRKVLSYCIPRFFSYDEQDLLNALRSVGVSRGDALMVHASLDAYSGFNGTPRSFIDTLKESVGEAGTLMMPSMPYQDSSKAYLMRNEVMNVRRTPSKMGLLSEVFRRGKDVKRSLSPTHPILAWGNDADNFLEGHELIQVPFGKGSPFDKLLSRKGKNLCVNVPLEYVTFSHYIEDVLKDRLPVNLYEASLYEGRVIDCEGNEIVVPCRVLSDQARRCRNDEILTQAVTKDGVTRRGRVGNTTLVCIGAEDYLDSARRMLDRGEEFFQSSQMKGNQ